MPEATLKFNTPAGQPIARELLIAYINTADDASKKETPKWSPIGSHTTESSEEFDWSEDSNQDILGATHTTAKKPIMTQSFDPIVPTTGDSAAEYIHKLAIIDQNVQALVSQDMLIAHYYIDVGGEVTNHFAERYDSCFVRPSGFGGEGGGNLEMPTEVTYGGNRTLGKVTKDGATVTFTEGLEAE